MKIHNFSAGPAILPATVIREAAKGVANYHRSGLSILEVSHRGPIFGPILEETEALLKELLNIPDGYHVIFTTGGASTQFAMAPMNFLKPDETAHYIDTGVWTAKSIKEVGLFGNVNVLASSEDKNYSYIPKFRMPKSGAYLYMCSNNTIYGTQFSKLPKSDIPLICDMSSDFLSRPVNVEDFAFIFAGAQKNVGPAGVTICIVRDDMLERSQRALPTMFNYATYVKKDSMFNTPPVYPIYVCMLTLRWLKALGGLEAIQRKNKSKSRLLYKEIDNNPLFAGTAEKKARSQMNVTFKGINADIEKMFLAECIDNGIDGIKGHRSVGGFRASIYNAMPRSSVKVLTELMHHFAERKA